METLSFDLGTSTLRVTTHSQVSLSDWEKVYESCDQLIRDCMTQLDALSPDSTVNKMNLARVDVPITLTPLVMDYLDTNLSHYLASKGTFNPFGVKFEPRLVSVDKDSIFKHLDFKLDNSLLTSYILDTIEEFLASTGLSNYLISTPHVFTGQGEVDWQVSFEHPVLEEEIEATIRNSSIQISTRDSSHKLFSPAQPLSRLNPFSNTAAPPSVLGLILQHRQSHTQAQILSSIALSKSHELEVKPVLQEIAVNAWILGADGKFKQVLTN